MPRNADVDADRDADGFAFGVWVDAIRWLAAATVLLTHADIRMLQPIGAVPSPGWPHIAVAFLAGFDHAAVLVFFVLSGLLVGGAVLREHDTTGRIDYPAYLTRRTVRLCVVLWPALSLAAGCIGLAIRYGAVERGIVSGDAPAALTLPVLLCNMAFLQTAACEQYAGNGALWSLFNEAWYYLLFPPLLLAARPGWPVRLRLLVFAAVLTTLAGLTVAQFTVAGFTGVAFGPYFVVWLIGAWVAWSGRPALRSPAIAGGVFLAALLAVRLFVRRGFAAQHPVGAAALDFALSLLFGVLLLSMKSDRALRPPPWPSLHRRLAGFSFSLYATHIPVLTLAVTLMMAGLGVGWQMRPDGAAVWLVFGAALLVCIGVAWLFARVTEAQTARVRQALTARRPQRLRQPL